MFHTFIEVTDGGTALVAVNADRVLLVRPSKVTVEVLDDDDVAHQAPTCLLTVDAHSESQVGDVRLRAPAEVRVIGGFSNVTDALNG